MDKCKGSSDGWNRDGESADARLPHPDATRPSGLPMPTLPAFAHSPATCLRYGAPNGTVVCFWCGRHLEILKSGKITLGKQKLAIGSMGRVN